jgi:hypothetical protein
MDSWEFETMYYRLATAIKPIIEKVKNTQKKKKKRITPALNNGDVPL